MLMRTRDHVFATLNTSGLTPGTAVTFWWAFFTARATAPPSHARPPILPTRGASSVASGGGQIVGADGTASFRACIAAPAIRQASSLAWAPFRTLEPLRAQIHLVVRTHGTAILGDPLTLSQQLSQFNGGCPPNTCAKLQASIHQP
jgi:hypothetical protein